MIKLWDLSYDHDAGRACELAQGFAALLDQHAEG
ncbi:hypothetical protein EES42_16930 [Streptomyces sp. ADI95-17]|nr:hypothetical protein EES42_16930 [Streptomyces sp. ADI95-17]